MHIPYRRNSLIKYLESRLTECMTMESVRRLMTSFGFMNYGGSFKTAYVKDGCEVVFKVLNTRNIDDENLPDIDRETKGIESFDWARAEIFNLFRNRSCSLIFITQEKVNEYEDMGGARSARAYKSLAHIDKKIKKIIKSEFITQYIDAEFYNFGFKKNGQPCFFDGL